MSAVHFPMPRTVVSAERTSSLESPARDRSLCSGHRLRKLLQHGGLACRDAAGAYLLQGERESTASHVISPPQSPRSLPAIALPDLHRKHLLYRGVRHVLVSPSRDLVAEVAASPSP